MFLNISQAEDAFLDGNANWETFIEEFDNRWFSPMGEMMFIQMWQQMPPEVHAELARMHPEAHERIRQAMEAKNVSRI